MASIANYALVPFLAGILTCTWDKIFFFDVGGFTLKIHQLFFLISFLMASLSAPRKILPQFISCPTKRFGLAMLILALYYGISSPWSHFPLKSFLYSGWLAFNLITIWLTAVLLQKKLSAQILSYAVAAAMAIQSLVIGVDHLAYQFGYKGGLIGFNQDTVLRWGASRPHGFTSEPSYAAAFLCFALVFTYSSLRKRNLGYNLPLILAGIFGVFALVATTSRTGWISLSLSLVLLFSIKALRDFKIPWRELGISFVIVGSIAAIFLLSTPVHQRGILDKSLVSSIVKGTDGSGNSRVLVHHYAWQIAKDTHFLGTGLGASFNYWRDTTDASHLYAVPPSIDSKSSHGHEFIMSTWGQLLAEGGIPGISLYLLATIFLIYALWKKWKETGDRLALGSLVSALVFFGFVAFLLGNVARGDIWIWYAIWSRVAMKDLNAS